MNIEDWNNLTDLEKYAYLKQHPDSDLLVHEYLTDKEEVEKILKKSFKRNNDFYDIDEDENDNGNEENVIGFNYFFRVTDNGEVDAIGSQVLFDDSFFDDYGRLKFKFNFDFDDNCEIEVESNKIKDLTGFPSICNRLDIKSNSLTSLRGCPTYMTFLSITNANITSLKGLSSCFDIRLTNCNNLKDLTGCPNQVSSSIYISGCNELESLKGCPKQLDTLILCDCNKIKSLEGCPNKIKENLVCEDCSNLESLKFFPEKIRKTFHYKGCNKLLEKDINILKQKGFKVSNKGFYCYDNI